MPLTDSQKLDILWKKIVYGVTETSVSDKSGPNESISSPLPIYGHTIFSESDLITEIPPTETNSVISIQTVECIADPTVAGDRTWLTSLGDWIPPTFGSGYQVKVYGGNPSTGGSLLNPLTTNEEWVFDYVSGVLYFANNIPSEASNGIWIVGYQYVGAKGISASNTETTFISLTDTPETYSGMSGKYVVVNGDSSGLDFSANVLEVYSFTLTYNSDGDLSGITNLPSGWTAEAINENSDVVINHTTLKTPKFCTFLGESVLVSGDRRLRVPNVINELIYNTNVPNRFTVLGLTATKVGTGSNGNATFNIFF